MIEQGAFRDAASYLGAAINVVTTDGAGGLAGFTASAVCSLTDSPAMLLVCLQKKSSAYEAVKSNRVVCINTLGSNVEDYGLRFSKKTSMSERFIGCSWEKAQTGSPVLPGAIVSFDCDVSDVKEVHTHEILLCRVREIVYGDREQAALIYYNREFHHLG